MRLFNGYLIIGLISILAVQVFFYLERMNTLPPSQLSTQNAQLCDPDCYTRLVLIQDWVSSSSWYTRDIKRSNAPYGEVSHWTKPVNILLVIGGIVFRPFCNSFDSAVFWFGVFFSPLLLFAALGILLKSLKKYFSQKEAPYIILFSIFSFCQPSILGYFIAGRPDHHSLLLLLFIVFLCVGFRVLTELYNKRLCTLVGLIAALGLWVSVEFIAAVIVFLSGLGLGWLSRGGDYMSKIKKILETMMITLTIILFIEYPPHTIFTPEYDRISIVFWVFFGLSYLFCYLSEYVAQHFAGRLIYSIIGLSLILIATQTFFPYFIQGPYALMSPQANALWMKFVNEVEPLLNTSPYPLSNFLIWLGTSLIAIPFLLYQLLNSKAHNRRLWNFLLWGIIIFTGLTFYQVRWCSYAQILLLFPILFMIPKLLPWIDQKTKDPWTRPFKILVIFLLALGFPLLGELIKPQSQKDSDKQTLVQSTPIAELCHYLREQPRMRIACLLDIAPEIIYRTHNEVIGTPYHRNGDGILDTYLIMTDTGDYKTAQDIIQKRSITHLLIFKNDREKVFYQTNKTEPTLWKNLKEGIIPDFLMEEQLPENLTQNFKLLRVKN